MSIPTRASRDDHTVMTPSQQSPHSSIFPDVPDVRPPISSDDTGDGLLLFVVFIVAVLTSTAAVVLIALLDEWWVVGFGFASHVIVTAIVVLTIVQAMGGSYRSIARRNALSSSSGLARTSRAGSERAAPVTIPASVTLPATALERRRHQLAARDGGRHVVPLGAHRRRRPRRRGHDLHGRRRLPRQDARGELARQAQRDARRHLRPLPGRCGLRRPQRRQHAQAEARPRPPRSRTRRHAQRQRHAVAALAPPAVWGTREGSHALFSRA